MKLAVLNLKDMALVVIRKRTETGVVTKTEKLTDEKEGDKETLIHRRETVIPSKGEQQAVNAMSTDFYRVLRQNFAISSSVGWICPTDKVEALSRALSAFDLKCRKAQESFQHASFRVEVSFLEIKGGDLSGWLREDVGNKLQELVEAVKTEDQKLLASCVKDIGQLQVFIDDEKMAEFVSEAIKSGDTFRRLLERMERVKKAERKEALAEQAFKTSERFQVVARGIFEEKARKELQSLLRDESLTKKKGKKKQHAGSELHAAAS